MSVFKTTFSRSNRAHPSDNAVIAFPGALNSTGTNTTATASKLINSAANFITIPVYPGDVVHNDTAGTSATVVTVDSATQLTLNANIFTTTAQAYAIYSMGAQAGIGNTGAILYIGGAGNVSVITIGGDIITFTGVAVGTTLPIQVSQLRATGTTATLINAMW